MANKFASKRATTPIFETSRAIRRVFGVTLFSSRGHANDCGSWIIVRAVPPTFSQVKTHLEISHSQRAIVNLHGNDENGTQRRLLQKEVSFGKYIRHFCALFFLSESFAVLSLILLHFFHTNLDPHTLIFFFRCPLYTLKAVKILIFKFLGYFLLA